jgi:hypothetical protein
METGGASSWLGPVSIQHLKHYYIICLMCFFYSDSAYICIVRDYNIRPEMIDGAQDRERGAFRYGAT